MAADDAPLRLVPSPTADERAQESVVGLLRAALEKAERGEIESVFLVMNYADHAWEHWESSPIQEFSRFIGRLEIAKHETVEDYYRQIRRVPPSS